MFTCNDTSFLVILSSTGFLTFINCRSVRWAMNVQDVFTFAKLLSLVVIILSGLVHIIRGKKDKSSQMHPLTQKEIDSI